MNRSTIEDAEFSNRCAKRVASFASELGVAPPQAAYSHDLIAAARNFAKTTGIAVRSFIFPGRNDVARHGAFVHPNNPGVIFINAAHDTAPLADLLAHERLHALSHDSGKGRRR